MIDFTLFDSSSFQDELVEKFEEGAEEVLTDGDERKAILNVMLYITECVMNDINKQANNALVMFCDLPHLIYYGTERDTYRLEAEAAKCKVRFTASPTAPETVQVAKGTRVTADGRVFFATDEDTNITPGEHADISCTATESGALGNGYSIGSINILADTTPYIDSVENIEASSNGADMESVEDFREEVLYAPLKFNTAGSVGSYTQKTKEVSASIKDVDVEAENANIYIYILCKGGELPSEELLKKALEYLTQKEIKPVGQQLFTRAAEAAEYEIEMEYKIAKEDYTRQSEIKAAVEEAVGEYIDTAQAKMGGAVNPEMIKKKAYVAGAASVEITKPEYTELKDYEVPKCISKQIIYKGLL